MNNNKKTHPPEVTAEVLLISGLLSAEFTRTKSDLRCVAKSAGMSVNSVKNIIGGKTANIASYCAIAKAMGTSLTALIQASSLKTDIISVTKNTPATTFVVNV